MHNRVLSNLGIPNVLAGFSSYQSPLQLLSGIAGLAMLSEFRGVLDCGGRHAEVVIEPRGSVTVCLPIENAPDARAALADNYTLPGNLRYAASNDEVRLLADLPLDRQGDLSRSFNELRRALSHRSDAAMGERAVATSTGPKGDDGTDDESLLGDAVERLGWPAESIVRRDRGWELRPKVKGQAVPVMLAAFQGQVRVQSHVSPAGDEQCSAAVAHQALLENARLHFARLVLAEGTVLSESCILATSLTPRRLADVVTAVAVAKVRTVAVLGALADEPHLARCYEHLFAAEAVAAFST